MTLLGFISMLGGNGQFTLLTPSEVEQLLNFCLATGAESHFVCPLSLTL